MNLKRFLFTAIIAAISLTASAQTTKEKQWYLFNQKTDGVNGISLPQAYEFLKNKKRTPIVVAVIDSGVDTLHEDLKNVLWHNPKEIPGNGIDDDGNGYVDDVYGWNFLGNKNGTNVNKASMEKARVYHAYKAKYATAKVDTTKFSNEQLFEYKMWKKASDEIEVAPSDLLNLTFIKMAYNALDKNNAIIKKEYKIDTFTTAQLEELTDGTPEGKKAKNAYLGNMKMLGGLEDDMTNVSLLEELKSYVDAKQGEADAKNIAPEDYRKIIGDNYLDFNDRYYGNPDVMAGTPTHGTHVSGIIAAQRGNGIGVEGIAEGVKIMAIRAVPDGDEYDKDIALAIRYAVDNGAKVINMSFGKYFSPEKKWVDEAFEYAASKDVLLIHAAGNEAKDSDIEPSFPNPNILFTNKVAPNVITVGAYGDISFNEGFAAPFSNYGKQKVNVFAPGMKIYNTVPGSAYQNQQGTSMASPVVAGIAGMLRSYYPTLSAVQIKQAIESSVTNRDLQVTIPGTKDVVSIAEISTSGGTVDAFAAAVYASEMKAEKQNKKEEKKTKKEKKKKKEKLPKATFEQSAPM